MKKLMLYTGVLLMMVLAQSAVSHAAASFIAESNENGINYLSGGVGKNEREILLDRQNHYDLKAVFALNSGAYLAYIDVRIMDANGRELVETKANGPWFYAELPPGTYKIRAEYENISKSRTIRIGQGLKRVMFHWKP